MAFARRVLRGRWLPPLAIFSMATLRRSIHANGDPVAPPASPPPPPKARTWVGAISSGANTSINAVAGAGQAAAGATVDVAVAAASATHGVVTATGRATLDAANAIGRVSTTAGRATIDATAAAASATHGAVCTVGRVTIGAASTLGRVAGDTAGVAGRVTFDAANAVGRVSYDTSAIAVAFAQWVAAQPFDKTPYAEDTLLMLKLDGFQGSPEAGGLWLKPGAAARIVRLPHGLRSNPGESVEAVVAAAVTEAGRVRLAVSVPRTHFVWETFVPAATPAIAVPGLSIDALGWANLGLLVSWSLAPAEPACSGIALVVHLSIGASVYGLGKSGIPLYDLPIPLTRITGHVTQLLTRSPAAEGCSLPTAQSLQSAGTPLQRADLQQVLLDPGLEIPEGIVPGAQDATIPRAACATGPGDASSTPDCVVCDSETRAIVGCDSEVAQLVEASSNESAPVVGGELPLAVQTGNVNEAAAWHPAQCKTP